MNELYYGDNLEVMKKHIKDNSVDLCYIDPPFNSNRNYNQIYTLPERKDTAQSQAFSDCWVWEENSERAFEEIITNKNSNYTIQTVKLIEGLEKVLRKGPTLAYLVYMTQRIQEIWRVLELIGSFYLHCDPTMSHYLKLLLDSVFITRGGMFLNEIVWNYFSGGSGKKTFAKKHDNISQKNTTIYFFLPKPTNIILIF